MDSYEMMQSKMLNKTITIKRFNAYLTTLNIQTILCIICTKFGDTIYYKGKPYMSIIWECSNDRDNTYAMHEEKKKFTKPKYVEVLSQLSNGSENYNYYNMRRPLQHAPASAMRELTPYEKSTILQLSLAERVNVLIRFKKCGVVQRDFDAQFGALDPLIVSCINMHLDDHDIQNFILASTQDSVRKTLKDAKQTSTNRLTPSPVEMNKAILEQVQNKPLLLASEFANVLADICEHMALDETKVLYLFYTDEKNRFHENRQEGIPTGEFQYIEPDASNVVKIHNARRCMQQRGWDGIIRKLVIEYRRARELDAWKYIHLGRHQAVISITTFIGKGDVQKLRKSVQITGTRVNPNQQDLHFHWSLVPWTQALAQRTNIVV